MKPIRTSSTTRVLNEPKDWDATQHGECIGLPITDIKPRYMLSYWQPSIADRFKILFGYKVRLVVVGRAHPPVMIDAMKEAA